MLDKTKDTSSDAGDTTQRNFRYQHAYGVILLIGAYIDNFDYVSIWCEHHEDLLCKKRDGKFDAYQIKTRKPELGEWTLSKSPILKSIGKFCVLEKNYGNHINAYYFVSNTSYSEVSEDIQDQRKLANCPNIFIRKVDKRDAHSDLEEPFKSKFSDICKEIDVTPDILFPTLKKVKFVKGPSRDDFDSVLSHDHISKIPKCQSFDPDKLDEIRDSLVAKLFFSSSLNKENGNTYWHFIKEDGCEDPELIAKRVDLDFIDEAISNIDDPEFKFALGLASIDLKEDRTHKALVAKMKKGDLTHYIKTMKRRSLSAEQHLIQLNYRDQDSFSEKLNQIISIVQSTCDDGHAIAHKNGEIDGLKMYQYVLENLRKLSSESPSKVEKQDQDLLLGVAGILTDECKVWWSNKFNLEDE